MPDDPEPFSENDFAAARSIFPRDDIQVHDGTLVIARPPDVAARFATDAILRSLHAYLMRPMHVKLEAPGEIRFDSYNVRRYAIAVWDTAIAIPIFVIVVLRREDHIRWGRGKVNRALELGVSRGLLVVPKQREAVLFEGIERTTVGDVIECDLLPNWSLAKAALFRDFDDPI